MTRVLTSMSGWPRGFAVLAAAAAIGLPGLAALAGCSGGPSSPQVASLGTGGGGPAGSAGSGGSGGSGGGGNSAGSGPKGTATQLVDDWATCMRSHGDPNQADPVINSDDDIEISMTNVSAAMAGQAHDSSGPCGHYLAAASSALRDGQPMPNGPDEAQLLKYSQCMRANGVPKYPDPVPGSGQTDLNDIGMSLTSPVFVKANDLCAKETGVPSGNGPGPAGVVQVQSCNAPAGRQCPSGGPGGPDGPLPSVKSGGNG